MLQKLQIVSENKDEIWCRCCFHYPDKDASLLISKTGEFSGFYKCFGCGAFGPAKDLGLDITSKAYKKEHKYPNPIDWKRLSYSYEQRVINEFRYNIMQNKWDVSIKTLKAIQLGWSGEAFTFPLRNENFEIIGIQRQFLNGSKKAVNGSKLGLVIPNDIDFNQVVIVCEGVHDAAVVYDLGFQSIARPGANAVVSTTVKLLEGCTVLIIPDNDKVGIDGANKLAKKLEKVSRISVMNVENFNGEKDAALWVEKQGKSQVRDVFKRTIVSMRTERIKN